MVKHCRQCDCIMPGRAVFCPRCREPCRQVWAHSLADAADLLQPPVYCGTCRKQLNVPGFFCPRCGADWIFGTPPPGGPIGTADLKTYKWVVTGEGK